MFFEKILIFHDEIWFSKIEVGNFWLFFWKIDVGLGCCASTVWWEKLPRLYIDFWRKNIFFRLRFLKIKFRHEKLIFFPNFFFPYKIWLEYFNFRPLELYIVNSERIIANTLKKSFKIHENPVNWLLVGERFTLQMCSSVVYCAKRSFHPCCTSNSDVRPPSSVRPARDNWFLRRGTEGGFIATVYWYFELLIFKDPEVNRSQKS